MGRKSRQRHKRRLFQSHSEFVDQLDNFERKQLSLSQQDAEDLRYDKWWAKNLAKGSAAQGTAKWNYRPPCHEGMVRVGPMGTAMVYAGSYLDLRADRRKWALLLAVGGELLLPSPLVTANTQGAQFLEAAGLEHDVMPPWIAIDWTDYGVPAFNPEHWAKIAAIVEAQEGDVAVFCQGGHGRTGTTLAILGCATGLIPEKNDPVAWVRNRYCEEAVESWGQIAHIERITGRKTKCEPMGINSQFGFSYAKPAASNNTTATTAVPRTLTVIEGDSGKERYLTNAAGDVVWRESVKDRTAESTGQSAASPMAPPPAGPSSQK